MKHYAATICFLLICQTVFAHKHELEAWGTPHGGNITIIPTGDPIQAGGLEFVAEPGFLIQGESAAPFAFFIPNNAAPGNVTLGSLGTPVTIDGPVTLDVVNTAIARSGDITATWGKGTTPTAFPVSIFPEPAGFSLAAVGVIGLLGLRAPRRQLRIST